MENLGLPNYDICFNVLSRLATKDLLRLKCVCKGWCQLISDRVFKRVQSCRREPISGFFIQRRYQLYSDGTRNKSFLDVIRDVAYIPVELQGAGLHRSIFNFLPEDVMVLASCNGLICCRSSFSLEEPALYVCNPLNKEWIKLNWKEPDRKASIALAFNPCQGTADSSTSFKLVSVQEFRTESEDQYFSFNIYSSDTDSWRKSRETCTYEGFIFSKSVVFVEGILHWLTEFGKILAFDVENEKSLVISVPDPDSDLDLDSDSDSDSESDIVYSRGIGESDGQLHYINVSDNGIYVWSLEDYDKFKWNLKYSRSSEVIFEEHSSLLDDSNSLWPMDTLAFKDGFLLMDSPGMLLYNTETNKMDEVLSANEVPEHKYHSSSALTYSMSLVPLNSA